MKVENRICFNYYRKIISATTFSLLSLLSCFSQKENNMWTFGYRNGLDFNTNPPTLFESEVVLAWEGMSSVSDENGNLLFYTDANVILDVNGNPMPNGHGILGNTGSMFFYEGIFGSSSQGVVIAQRPDNPHQYYVFVASSAEDRDWNTHTGKLRYTIVDMQLNGGLGDVVPGQKNIVIDEDINEKVTIVQGAGCFYWLISHGTGNDFKVYKVDNTMVHPPTHYPGILTNVYGGGCIKISPDKKKIVHSLHYQDGINDSAIYVLQFIEIGDFDAATGVISNLQTVTSYSTYSVEFSANSQRLYTSCIGGLEEGYVYQYDLSLLPNVTAVNASKTLLTVEGSGEMRSGPDGKIYFKERIYDPTIGNQPRGIGIIHNPNALGLASNLESSVFSFADLTTIPVSDSLSPNAFAVGIGQNAVVIKPDTLVFNHPDLFQCKSTDLILEAPEGFETYLWDNGSNQQEREIETNGDYTVTSSNTCSVRTDNYTIEFIEEPKMELQTDFGELCDGEEMELSITTDHPSNIILWSTGNTTETIIINKPGIYSVTVENNCGTIKDSITINSNCEPFIPSIHIPNVFTPNGDGINDVWMVKVSDNFIEIRLSVLNRWGNEVFYADKKNTGWNGMVNGKQASEGVYFYKADIIDDKQQTKEYSGFFHLER